MKNLLNNILYLLLFFIIGFGYNSGFGQDIDSNYIQGVIGEGDFIDLKGIRRSNIYKNPGKIIEFGEDGKILTRSSINRKTQNNQNIDSFTIIIIIILIILLIVLLYFYILNRKND